MANFLIDKLLVKNHETGKTVVGKIQNISYLNELPTANEDSADLVSINNVLYAKQVNNGVYSYAEIGGGAPITEVDTLPEANKEEFEKHKLYITGEALQYLAKVPLLEPNVSQVNTLPVGLQLTSAAAVGTDIYIFGGSTSNGAVNTIYKYSTLTNTTTTLSTTLPSKLRATSAAAVGDNIYIFGGYDKYAYVPTRAIYKYSKSENTITSVSAGVGPSLGISSAAAAAVGTDIYIFGGLTSGVGNSTKRINTIYKYSTLTNTTTTLSTTLPVSLSGLSAAAVGTDIYIFGGSTSNGAVNTIYKYSTTTGVISDTGTTLPAAAVWLTSITVGSDIYVFCNSNIYKYSPTSNQIVTLSVTTTYYGYGSAAAVGDNIYIFGGSNYTNHIREVAFGFDYQFKTLAAKNDLEEKQDTLVSGTNIKTINNESILGSGNIEIKGGGVEFIDITGLDILPTQYQNEETLKTAILFDTDHLLRLTWIDDMYYFGNTDDFQYRYLSIDTSDWVIMRYDLQEIAKAPKSVNLNTYVPNTATNCTLESSVLATLQASDSNYIVFNNEIFKLADKQHNEGYLVYSHNGHDTTGCFFQKCITITISTRGWVLEEQENASKTYVSEQITSAYGFSVSVVGDKLVFETVGDALQGDY